MFHGTSISFQENISVLCAPNVRCPDSLSLNTQPDHTQNKTLQMLKRREDIRVFYTLYCIISTSGLRAAVALLLTTQYVTGIGSCDSGLCLRVRYPTTISQNSFVITENLQYKFNVTTQLET